MTGLSSDTGSPKPFQYSSYHYFWTPELGRLYNEDLLSPNYGISSDESMPRRRSTRTKKTRKKHSKSAKRKRERRIEGYILQVIGLLCLILAAVKSFEPLTGVGFTLVLIGYNKNAKKESRIGKSLTMDRPMVNHSCFADLRNENKSEQTKRKKRKHDEKRLALEHCDLNKPIVNGEEMI